MINDCCSKAMHEIDTAGISEGFSNYGAREKGDSLETSYECVECKERWIYRVQTQAPDRKIWLPADQSRFESKP